MKRTMTTILALTLLLPVAAQAQIENREAGEKYNEALSLFRQGQYDQSLALALESAKLEPGNYLAHYLAGLVYKRNRNADASIAQYEAAIKANPNYFQCEFALAEVYNDLKNDAAKAIEHYQKAGDISLQLNQPYLKAFTNLGALLMRQQRWDEALQAWGRAAQLEPTNEVARDALGHIYYEKGDYETALMNFRQAQMAKPTWFEPYWHQADVLNKLGRYDESIRMADEALSRQPGHGGSLYEKGLSLKGQEKWDAAIEALQLARRDNTWRSLADYQIDLIKNRDTYVIPPA